MLVKSLLILFPLFIALLLSNISIACLKRKFPSVQGGGAVVLYCAIAFPVVLFVYLMTYSCTFFNSSYTYEESPDEKCAVHAIGVSNTLLTPGVFRYLVRDLESREVITKGAYVFPEPIDMKMFTCKVNWNDDGSIGLLLITDLPKAVIPGTRYWNNRDLWSAATNTIAISTAELKAR